MQSQELSGRSLSYVHQSAGARAYRASDSHGAPIDPVVTGKARRFALGNGISLSIVEQINEVAQSETMVPAGRQLTLFLGGGRCGYAVGNGKARAVVPGHMLLTASARDYACHLELQPCQTYRFVAIGFDDRLFADHAQHGPADDPLLRLLDLGSIDPYCSGATIGLDIRRLADDLFALPAAGACGALLAEARALEILVKAAPSFSLGGEAAALTSKPRLRLSSADIERIHEARRLIETELDTPLTLTRLSRRVGINLNKLKAGFRQVFGRTVVEHAMETRLAAAHALLMSSDLPVSTIAYRVGYDPAYFSVLFRRRYGVPPSRLVRD